MLIAAAHLSLRMSKQMAPVTELIFGCQMRVRKRTFGGLNGYVSGIRMSSKKVPFSYGVSGGPCGGRLGKKTKTKLGLKILGKFYFFRVGTAINRSMGQIIDIYPLCDHAVRLNCYWQVRSKCRPTWLLRWIRVWYAEWRCWMTFWRLDWMRQVNVEEEWMNLIRVDDSWSLVDFTHKHTHTHAELKCWTTNELV